MPKLVRFYIRHVLIGFSLSAIFLTLLLYFDVAGLYGLITGSDAGLLAGLVFWVLNGIVFAGVQFGFAVMALGREDDSDGPRGGLGADVMSVPVRVEKSRQLFDTRR
ncbi:MAG: hypothetical protein AB3N11_06080 [Arenibacterium sp.]